MLKWLAAFLLLLTPALQAKVHFINRGVKYHIGDDRFNTSIDSTFLDAYPVVGQEWIQAFTVSEEDTVKVRIEHVWGVDDCPYCKVIVSIGEHDMGRLTADNNHEPFNTLEPLAMHVVAGRTYLLKIASYGDKQVDDFAIEGVSVETQRAEVTFLQPGPILKMPTEPMPRFAMPVAPKSPCEGVKQLSPWLPEEARSRGSLDLQGSAERHGSASLSAGDFVQIYVKAQGQAQGDRVGQGLEILLGADAPSGWVFSFAPGSDEPAHGNLKIGGRYSAPAFGVASWKKGAFNELRLARCPDGRAHLWLNGQELAQSVELPQAGAEALGFKVIGLSAQFAEKPY